MGKPLVRVDYPSNLTSNGPRFGCEPLLLSRNSGMVSRLSSPWGDSSRDPVTGAGDRLGSLGIRTPDLRFRILESLSASFLHLVQSCPLATRGGRPCPQLPGRCLRLGGLHSREAQVPGAVVAGSEPDNIAGGIAQEADRR